MEDQEPISLEVLCDLLDCAAKAADLVTGEKSDWSLRDRALPLLRILVEEEVAQNGPLDPQGRSQKLKHL
jgi:hypothetical protein